MKRLLIIVVCSTTLFACSNAQKSNGNNMQHEQEKCGTASQNKNGCTKLTTEEFTKRVADISKKEWKYLGDKPAIIDFYADWCGPCRMIAPTLEKLAEKYNGELYIYKVNIDNEPELAQRFRISAVPTIMFVPIKGEPVTERGVISMEGFERYINRFLRLKQKP